MRLDKFLTVTGTCTRSEAKRAVRAGGVTVNGIAPRTSDVSVNEESDVIVFCGKTVKYRKYT